MLAREPEAREPGREATPAPIMLLVPLEKEEEEEEAEEEDDDDEPMPLPGSITARRSSWPTEISVYSEGFRNRSRDAGSRRARATRRPRSAALPSVRTHHSTFRVRRPACRRHHCSVMQTAFSRPQPPPSPPAATATDDESDENDDVNGAKTPDRAGGGAARGTAFRTLNGPADVESSAAALPRVQPAHALVRLTIPSDWCATPCWCWWRGLKRCHRS